MSRRSRRDEKRACADAAFEVLLRHLRESVPQLAQLPSGTAPVGFCSAPVGPTAAFRGAAPVLGFPGLGTPRGTGRDDSGGAG